MTTKGAPLTMADLIDEKLGAMTGAKKGDTVKKYSGELIALKRTSVPEDVSNTVHFLASGDSDYMTGKLPLPLPESFPIDTYQANVSS